MNHCLRGALQLILIPLGRSLTPGSELYRYLIDITYYKGGFVLLKSMAVLFLAAQPVYAQIQATTSDGQKVLLFPDGTWKYVNTEAQAKGSAPPPTATEKIEIWRGKGAVYFDPVVWRMAETEPGHVTLTHADGDLYAMVISERMTVSLEALKKIAVSNAREAAPDARIVEEHVRRVNGIEVLELQIRMTINEMPVVYLGYYYAGSAGVVQIVTYTAANLFEEYKEEARRFLNGFKVTDK